MAHGATYDQVQFPWEPSFTDCCMYYAKMDSVRYQKVICEMDSAEVTANSDTDISINI